MNRDERIEEYYHRGTRELAERIVDLEDKVKHLKANNKELVKLYMKTTREKNELDPSRLESALRMYVSGLDYGLHQEIDCDPDGLNGYLDEVDYFLRCWETAGEGN